MTPQPHDDDDDNDGVDQSIHGSKCAFSITTFIIYPSRKKKCSFVFKIVLYLFSLQYLLCESAHPTPGDRISCTAIVKSFHPTELPTSGQLVNYHRSLINGLITKRTLIT